MIDLILIFTIVFGIWCGFIGRYQEKKEWNDGICSISGKKWIHFDTNSQGGRGYKDNEGNYCWISWGVDKNYNN